MSKLRFPAAIPIAPTTPAPGLPIEGSKPGQSTAESVVPGTCSTCRCAPKGCPLRQRREATLAGLGFPIGGLHDDNDLVEAFDCLFGEAENAKP